LAILQILDISHNRINEIPKTFVESLNGSLDIFNAGGNPFSCTCTIEPFRKWILTDRYTRLIPGLQYTCYSPNDLSGQSIAQIHLDCKSHLVLYISSGISSGIVSLLLVVLVVKYRWHIRYRLFLMLHWPKQNRPLDEERDPFVNRVRYDAFVSYAHESNRDLNWVLNDFRKNMEEGLEPFRLCIGHARDFVPGTPLLETITEAIHSSRKTVIILSPSYLESEWCYFETQHAWLRLLNEGQDVIILVLLDPIPDAKMTLWLRQFLCKKEYLKWPKDKPGQNLFFRCTMLKTRTAVDRRYDV
ncbi:toll-like receptor 2, partial [Amphiura filiformis]|uniref:toll-like receptor 2 n=1 Tax=Amphiura filiformis TaxID=82378 RepID=UPI003B20FECB